MTIDKPPYRVPSMVEIAAIPWNGFNAISTFSGAGGSSLGYKIAGLKVLWANEFIPAAQEVYRANHPNTILDTRDIRIIQPQEILDAIRLQPGELDLFDGSPPCASFSTAGKREAGWGKVKQYSDTKQRTDDLFFEYTRILQGLQPKVFVAENVSGLVKGTAKGYFKEILAALKECGYVVEAKLLDAQWLGVPQMRQRIIFVGVRNDLGLLPAFPKPLGYRYSVRDAIGITFRPKSYASNGWIEGDRPAAAIQASGQYFVEDANGLRSKGQGQGHIWLDVSNSPMPTIQAQRPVRVVAGVGTKDGIRSLDKPSPSVLTPVRQHTTSELTIVEVEADISRYAIGDEWDNTAIGDSNKRFFSLKRAAIDGPSHGVTAEGGNTSLASVTHPTEKRKFSIAELRRICAFPDDFTLTGTYAQQWERLGRAVPPVMMSHIAATIRDEILCKLK